MKPPQSKPSLAVSEEIIALIETLHRTEQRIEELTAGEVDTVTDRNGRTLMLGRAQDRMRESQAVKQAAILNALPAHVALLDTAGTVVAVNEAWRRFAGTQALEGPDHAVGVNYLDICDTAKGEGSAEAHQAAAGIRSVLSGAAKSFWIEYPCDSPTVQRWFLMTVTPLSEDHPDGVVVMHQDVSEHKRDEENVRILSLVVEQSPVSIVITDRAGLITYVNPRFEQVTGYSSAEAVGMSPRILKSGTTPAQTYAELWRAIATGGEWRGELCNRRKDGTLFWEHAAISGLKDERGNVGHYIAVKEDITERKRLEEVHQQAQKLESLGTLAAGIAHDFNNILTAIRGNADLVAKDTGPDHIAAQSLEEIRKAGMRASELVRRIMTFGRSGETAKTVIDLGAVAGEVLKLLRSTLPAGIALQQRYDEDTPHVLADAGQVHEVLVNLTNNAAQAIGPRAGSISYRLEPVQAGETFAHGIPGLKAGHYARLTVTDSGCGMDTATLKRIFDAFYTTKSVGEGTGLGLSMVHGTMRNHGGAVTVESAPGKGSRFALYFPAAVEKAQREARDDSLQMPRGAGRRVLYVDDEEALVLLARRTLSRLGHDISGFTDPEEALEAFRAHPNDFDIMVTDLSMPHMSGLELAREVLALRPGMPVLMTTGYMRPGDEAVALAAGIREIILKPATMDDLARTLDRMIVDSSDKP